MKTDIQVFISTGDKQAMYTLRTVRHSYSKDFSFMREAFIKILSNDLEKATRLAEEYTSNLRERLTAGNAETEVFFIGHDVDELSFRRGKLSVEDTANIIEIEAGKVPFGKHKGKMIADLDDGYLCWLTDQLKNDPSTMKPAFFALCTVGSGIASDRGLLAKRQAIRDAKHEEDLKSKFFGELGKRYTEEVMVVSKFKDEYDGDFIQWKYTFKIGDDILTHNSSKLDLERGTTVKMTFTVKYHNTTSTGVNRTYVNRPKVV